MVLAWAFDVLGVHRVELQAVAGNSRAVNCYLACGFRRPTAEYLSECR
jgi:RimJ/RimL family protein N-acetyltransferase